MFFIFLNTCLCTAEARIMHQIPSLELQFQIVSHHVCLESGLHPLQEQPVPLMVEPSL